MDLLATSGRSTAEKILLTSSGVLAFAIGMGPSKAHADLIVTSFDDAQKAALQAGDPVNFGPAGDPSGFTAQIVFGAPAEFLSLTGNGLNQVATIPGCSNIDSSNCLATFNPGDVVDSNANFSQSGSLKTFGTIKVGPGDFVPGPKLDDGNYFLGLDEIAGVPDPYGWLEITVTGGNPALDAFAFEDVDGVGAPIPATPEPASLALFAVGGSAVLAARRRRRGAALS